MQPFTTVQKDKYYKRVEQPESTNMSDELSAKPKFDIDLHLKKSNNKFSSSKNSVNSMFPFVDTTPPPKFEKEFSPGRSCASIECLTPINTCEICGETDESNTLVSNDQCSHLYHVECLQDHVEKKLEGKQFPYRCPLKSCKKSLGRGTALNVISDETLAKDYDVLNFINRISKGRKALVWWNTCISLSSQTINEATICYYCRKKAVLVKDVAYVEPKFEPKDDMIFKDTCIVIRNALQTDLNRCEKCLLWIQSINGCENYKCNCPTLKST